MLTITLSFALIPYGFVVILFALLAAFSVFSMLRHGATTGTSFLATFAFLAGATFVLFFTWEGLKGTDWQQQVQISPTSFMTSSAPTL